jgi:hypothetical protein
MFPFDLFPGNAGNFPTWPEDQPLLYRSGHGPRFEDPQRRPGASEGGFCSGLQVASSTPPVFLYFVENTNKMQLLFAFFFHQPVMLTCSPTLEHPRVPL